MSTGNRIKYLRELNNLTQVELGRIAGVSDKAVSTWENGTAEPRMGAIQKMADYFGVSKGWIIDDDPSSSSEADQADRLFIDDKEKHLIDVYRGLNVVGQRKLLEYADDLTANAHNTNQQNTEKAI